MKTFAVAVAVGASAVMASEPNKALGTKLGDILAAASADPAFAAAYNNEVLSKMPVVQNPAVGSHSIEVKSIGSIDSNQINRLRSS